VQLFFEKKLEKIYPACRSILDPLTWNLLNTACSRDPEPETFPDTVRLRTAELGLPEFLAELARLELAVNSVATEEIQIPSEVDQILLNPSVQLLQLSWKNLTSALNQQDDTPPPPPERDEQLVLVWRDPKTRNAKTRAASDEDLLVLKIVVEGIDPAEVAAAGQIPIGAVDAAIDRAARRGILIKPRSRIRREGAGFPEGRAADERFLSARVLTLQWHITQAWDLHCKHCYDRSNRSSLELDQALRVLDDLRAFCRSRHVGGQVSFTGGNPLLYPRFAELYRAASERGLAVAVLGNPAPRKRVEELLEIEPPAFFQVSLEGLSEHNDAIRGAGHFERTMEFLGVLRELRVYSMVMLTLTEGNVDQVLPLAEMLRGMTDVFHFNRLSMVGEGANLRLPPREKYAAFLGAYLDAAASNPVMGLKDNLINIKRYEKGLKPFGGCAGFGCGAAFNFVAVLPDGEAHACRKFPSPIGNILEQSLADIYDSEIARAYRKGCKACESCAIRPVCGGCLASAYSHGLDIFEARDPFCFMESQRGDS
jgi:selenobiotic family peptide radical SAM maturase